MSNGDIPICPCEGLHHPQGLFNRPGQSTLNYRVGDYTSFRQALLQALPDENELRHWRPGAEGDLAVQLVEWWAYLADILTFYNERIAHQAYLRTADLPESLSRLIRLLGYRPRPGIGARGELAALLVNPDKPLILPQGFAIQSKPGPGQQPQIFELNADTLITSPDTIPADPVTDDRLLPSGSTFFSILLKGAVTTVKAGEELLLLKKGWMGVDDRGIPDPNYALVTVQSVDSEAAPRGKVNTRVTFASTPALPGNALVSEYRLLKSTQSAHLWPYPVDPNLVIKSDEVHLESITRQIQAGDPVLFRVPVFWPPPQLLELAGNTPALTHDQITSYLTFWGTLLRQFINWRNVSLINLWYGLYPYLIQPVFVAFLSYTSDGNTPTLRFDYLTLDQIIDYLTFWIALLRLFIDQGNTYLIDLWISLYPYLIQPAIADLLSYTPEPKLVSVLQNSEVIWLANGDPKEPNKRPIDLDPEEPSIPIPHTCLRFTPDLAGLEDWIAIPTKFLAFCNELLELWSVTDSTLIPPLLRKYAEMPKATLTVHYDWQEVGQLIASPVTSVAMIAGKEVTLTPVASSPIALPDLTDQPVLLEDATGRGAKAVAATSAGNITLRNLTHAPATLTPPLRVLMNRLPVSRGQTVPREILGSGNGAIAGQEFVLKKAPLTYLAGQNAKSGENYTSTLRVWVDGVEWQEAPSFYGQPPHARIFVTREDEEQRTHVLFGDGINGVRLPSGVNNVVARYRYGSGAEAPEAGSLSVIVKPYPNLKAILNPVPVGGGEDPDPPDQIRRYAPRSVLTFSRAVSRDDYETIAAQTPGVARARAYWRWNADQQRALVEIYVGDDDNAVEAAKTTLRGAGDPNRPVQVLPATPIPIRLTPTLRLDPTYEADWVQAQVRQALTDPDRGLFGDRRVRIGQVIYQSQIYAACLGVTGVLAVRGLKFAFLHRSFHILDGVPFEYSNWQEEDCPRHDPGEGSFYQLRDSLEDLTLQEEERLT